MKEKDCKDNEILNPKTKRCVKNDTKIGIEILFNQKDNDILNKYEMIDGKIVKKCEKDKIRNQETKRCVKKNEATKITKSSYLNKKIEAIKKDKSNSLSKKVEEVKITKSNNLSKKVEVIKKVKKALIPFINRVSADIYYRNRYLILMRRELKGKKEGCLRVYKENPDKTYSYRIGNRIILKKRIGSNSVYGIVYLSEFREKNKKIFTFASKVYPHMNSKTKMELELLNKLTNVVRMELCPHFPIFYGHVICEKILNNKNKFNKDSFKKSNLKDKTISQKINKFPDLVIINLKKRFITTFNELANGDLWKFFELYGNNSSYIINALIQQLLSIMFFNYYTNRIHNDTHAGNFLYHKIKAGGYFHYKLFGIDYYLENLGFLWVIWDFDLSSKTEEAIKQYNKIRTNNTDYNRIMEMYLSYKDGGYNPYEEIQNNNNVKIFVKKLTSLYNSNYNFNNLNKHDINTFKTLIVKLPNIISSINIDELNKKISLFKLPKKMFDYIRGNKKINKIDNNEFLLKSLPLGAKIINKNPYMINEEDLFK
jgi:hypothetical protein